MVLVPHMREQKPREVNRLSQGYRLIVGWKDKEPGVPAAERWSHSAVWCVSVYGGGGVLRQCGEGRDPGPLWRKLCSETAPAISPPCPPFTSWPITHPLSSHMCSGFDRLCLCQEHPPVHRPHRQDSPEMPAPLCLCLTAEPRP